MGGYVTEVVADLDASPPTSTKIWRFVVNEPIVPRPAGGKDYLQRVAALSRKRGKR